MKRSDLLRILFISFLSRRVIEGIKVQHIETPSVILTAIEFPLTVHLELNDDDPFSKYAVRIEEWNQTIATSSAFKFTTEPDTGKSVTQLVQLHSSGWHQLCIRILREREHKSLDNSTHQPDFVYEDVQTLSLLSTPGIFSLLPPVMTLIISCVTQNVILALIFGLWCGATITARGNVVRGFFATFDTYWLEAVTKDGHAGVLLFTILLGGVIGVVQKSGGGHGLARTMTSWMTSRLRMSLGTFFLCFCIFFDDFSCILILGSSLRHVVERVGLSREKFATIVHAIGVCLPSIAPVSAWVGVEIGYIAAQLHALGLTEHDPFITCVTSIPHRFFPTFLMLFVFLMIILERDFGPMLKYERKAFRRFRHFQQDKDRAGQEGPDERTLAGSSSENALDPDPSTPLRWYNAVIPFTCIVLVTFFGMIVDGYAALDHMPIETRPRVTFLNALSHSDSVQALIRSSACGTLVAFVLILSQQIMTIDLFMNAWVHGIKDILEPTIVLLFAWGIGQVIEDIQTANYLASIIQDGFPPNWLPSITLFFCYIVSFATGSGFGTMAVAFPIIAPISFRVSGGNEDNLLQCFGSILGGSVFGNICSPIADTSIITTLAVKLPLSNHIETILPYSLVVALMAVLLGTVPIGLGWNMSLVGVYVTATVMFLMIILLCGTHVHEEEEEEQQVKDDRSPRIHQNEGELEHLLHHQDHEHQA